MALVDPDAAGVCARSFPLIVSVTFIDNYVSQRYLYARLRIAGRTNARPCTNCSVRRYAAVFFQPLQLFADFDFSVPWIFA